MYHSALVWVFVCLPFQRQFSLYLLCKCRGHCTILAGLFLTFVKRNVVAKSTHPLQQGYPALPRSPISASPLPLKSYKSSDIRTSTSLPSTFQGFSLTTVTHRKATMATSELQQRPNLHLERRGDIFILTLCKHPENRLNLAFCQDIIATFHYIQFLLGPLSSGAVITRGSDEKFFCTGVDLEEGDLNPFANSDGFYPMLATILDFPYPTVALLNGHTFGGACPFALAHDYRVMNSKRGFIQMVRSSALQIPSLS